MLVLANKHGLRGQSKKMYPLEVSAKELQPSLRDPSTDKAELKSDRPKRAAAVIVNGRNNITDQLESLP